MSEQRVTPAGNVIFSETGMTLREKQMTSSKTHMSSSETLFALNAV